MKKKIIIVFLIVSAFLIDIPNMKAEKKLMIENLELIKVFPEEEQKLFFKTTPFISIDYFGNVYAVDNREHTVYKISRDGKLILKFGEKGHRPGEFQWPVYIAVFKNKVFVSDNIGISIFDLNGKFIKRFRKFRPINSMGIFQNIVLLAEIGTENLIIAYDYEGKKINSFGKKFNINPFLYRGWSNDHLDGVINWGKIICSKNYIYYISYLFGDIFKYNPDGILVSKKEEKDINFIKKNREFYFRKGIIRKNRLHILKGKDLGVFLNDAFYFENKIYLLLSEDYLSFSRENTYCGEIWQLDENKLEIERKYSFRNQRNRIKKINTRSFTIGKDRNNKLFYISFYDDNKKDFFIGVYKNNK